MENTIAWKTHASELEDEDVDGEQYGEYDRKKHVEENVEEQDFNNCCKLLRK